jgi:hypothetical protein
MALTSSHVRAIIVEESVQVKGVLGADVTGVVILTAEQTSACLRVGGKCFKAVYFLDSAVLKMNPVSTALQTLDGFNG